MKVRKQFIHLLLKDLDSLNKWSGIRYLTLKTARIAIYIAKSMIQFNILLVTKLYGFFETFDKIRIIQCKKTLCNKTKLPISCLLLLFAGDFQYV
jgi:hypothetical protein